MMRRTAMPVLAFFCLCTVLAAQEQVTINDVAVEKLLEGVRVTIACSGSPSISSFVSSDPPAVVIDVMNATSKMERDRVESTLYPVSVVQVQPSEATSGVRVTIRLREAVEHKVAVDNGMIVAELGTRPVVPVTPVEQADAFAGKRLTIYVKDAEISSILRMLADQFDLNILVTQDVKSVVTVRLNDVPLRVGIDALLKAALCNMVTEPSGIIVIKPLKKEMYGEVQTRIFELDHGEASDLVKAINKVLSPQGNAEVGNRRVSGGGGSDRAHLVVVTDVPEALDRVAQFVAEYDQPSPQVAIESKFVETQYDAGEVYGFQWNIGLGATAGGKYDPKGTDELPIVLNNGIMVGKVSLANLSASFDLMASSNKSRVLASPRTVTLDNQTAKMTMSTDIPQREVTTDPKTGLVITTWRSRSVPIELEVTPHVTSDGNISMRVIVDVQAITGFAGTADEQRPIVARRTAETQVSVTDGEAAVIGGLTRDVDTRNIGKIPLLGDIPVLGDLLFKKTSVTRSKNELMIFIIPHIVPAG